MQKKLLIKTTKDKEVVDITETVNEYLSKRSLKSGTCFLFVIHTTCALTTADLDPGTDLDMLEAFEKIIPKLKYRHPHNPEHVSDHILSTLIGPSVLLPVRNSRLVLGTWQRVVLFEFYGPRERKVIFHFISGIN